MIDFERGCSIVYHLLQCQSIEGDNVEFGVYKGTTAALMASISEKRLWLYDAFCGLPEKRPVDGNDPTFEAGVLATDIASVRNTFKMAGLSPPKIVSKWFRDLAAEDLPDKIAFAHLDADFYDSMLDAVQLVYPRMTKGGIVIVDDYNHFGLPGVKAAIDEFFKDKSELIMSPIGVKGPDGPRQGPDQVMLHALFVKKS
jgi:O-methyltransferase